MSGTLIYVCTSGEKGMKKDPVDQAFLRADHGIEGDAHAGPWHRQVSLLDLQDIEAMRQSGVTVGPGDFGENMCIRDLNLSALGLGSRLRVGKTSELIISQIGKVCHTPCAIYAQTGFCIMPKVGLFARVVEGGTCRPGDSVMVVEQVDRSQLQAVVLTISDRCSHGETEDTAGPAVTSLLNSTSAFHVYRQKILPDEREVVEENLRHYADGHGIDLVLTVGGTGLSPRDVTPEATRAVVDRLAPGLDEAMRSASLEKTRFAMLSRGISGMRRTTLIVNLPGSEKAACENLSVILPALPHGLRKLRGDPSDCDTTRRTPALDKIQSGKAVSGDGDE